MVIVNLTGQATAVSQIQPHIVDLKNLLDDRKVLWDKLPENKKVAWVTSGIDPVMVLTWNIVTYLRNNYKEMIQKAASQINGDE